MNITELCVNCKQNNSCTMCWKTSNKKCPHFIQKTNADRIRAMSDEELADFFADKCLMATYSQLTDEKHNRTAIQIEAEKQTAFRILLKWLKRPVEENDYA